MCELNSTAFTTILATIIGGAVSLLATLLSQREQKRQQKQQFDREQHIWVRNKKESIYIELSQILFSIDIFISIDPEIAKCSVGKDELKDCMDMLSAFIDSHEGLLALYFPQSMMHTLIEIRADLYQLYSKEEKVDASELRESGFFEEYIGVIKKIIHLGSQMKQDIGIV